MREGEGTLSGLILFEIDPDGGRRLVARDRDLIPMIALRPKPTKPSRWPHNALSAGISS